MKKTIYSCLIALFIAGSSTLVSCLGDLDLKPIDQSYSCSGRIEPDKRNIHEYREFKK